MAAASQDPDPGTGRAIDDSCGCHANAAAAHRKEHEQHSQYARCREEPRVAPQDTGMHGPCRPLDALPAAQQQTAGLCVASNGAPAATPPVNLGGQHGGGCSCSSQAGKAGQGAGWRGSLPAATARQQPPPAAAVAGAAALVVATNPDAPCSGATPHAPMGPHVHPQPRAHGTTDATLPWPPALAPSGAAAGAGAGACAAPAASLPSGRMRAQGGGGGGGGAPAADAAGASGSGGGSPTHAGSSQSPADASGEHGSQHEGGAAHGELDVCARRPASELHRGGTGASSGSGRLGSANSRDQKGALNSLVSSKPSGRESGASEGSDEAQARSPTVGESVPIPAARVTSSSQHLPVGSAPAGAAMQPLGAGAAGPAPRAISASLGNDAARRRSEAAPGGRPASAPRTVCGSTSVSSSGGGGGSPTPGGTPRRDAHGGSRPGLLGPLFFSRSSAGVDTAAAGGSPRAAASAGFARASTGQLPGPSAHSAEEQALRMISCTLRASDIKRPPGAKPGRVCSPEELSRRLLADAGGTATKLMLTRAAAGTADLPPPAPKPPRGACATIAEDEGGSDRTTPHSSGRGLGRGHTPACGCVVM